MKNITSEVFIYLFIKASGTTRTKFLKAIASSKYYTEGEMHTIVFILGTASPFGKGFKRHSICNYDTSCRFLSHVALINKFHYKKKKIYPSTIKCVL